MADFFSRMIAVNEIQTSLHSAACVECGGRHEDAFVIYQVAEGVEGRRADFICRKCTLDPRFVLAMLKGVG